MLRNLCDFAPSGSNWPESRFWQGIPPHVARREVGSRFITQMAPGVPGVPGATMLGTAADRAAKTPGPVPACQTRPP
ncbi:hypothetical protein CBM2589_B280039 [Cupriavidus taiwanensis]|uniref:Uncharacterized protein n=1 Tax=Cupriavidus taiwanensis TaxID=164546 RepID=A0A975X323_9BURK|nr:hypothetical protein CBM2589_B280039 [Cupriavidus taiwanensis]